MTDLHGSWWNSTNNDVQAGVYSHSVWIVHRHDFKVSGTVRGDMRREATGAFSGTGGKTEHEKTSSDRKYRYCRFLPLPQSIRATLELELRSKQPAPRVPGAT